MKSIRLASINELDMIFRIIIDAMRQMDLQNIPQWDVIYPSRIIIEQDIIKQQIYVIEIDERIIGSIVINEDQSPEYNGIVWNYSGKILVVHRLTIHPDFQRKGFASSLMKFAENFAAQEGYNAIRLDAFTLNPGALALYEHRGYRKAGIVRFRKGDFFCYEKQIKNNQ